MNHLFRFGMWFLSLFFTLGAMASKLPDGAYCEWSSDKAWRLSSAHRETLCLNGLWRFRSEFRHSEHPKDTVVWRWKKTPSLSEWDVQPLPEGKVSASFDAQKAVGNGGSLRLDLDVPKRVNLYHVSTLIPAPSGESVVLRCDILNQVASSAFTLEVQDERGYTHFCKRGADLKRGTAWEPFELSFRVPSETTSLKLIVTRSIGAGAKGSLWIDNLQLCKPTHACRPEVPVPTTGSWGHALVPGDWSKEAFLQADDAGASRRMVRGWFTRQVQVPASWKGRHIQLSFAGVSTDGLVFCNGKRVGTIPYYGGELDVTDYVEPGKEFQLSVLVEARRAPSVTPHLGRSVSAGDGLAHRGITGDVFLSSCPAGIHLGTIGIETDVRRRLMRVRVPVEGASSGKNLTGRFVVRDKTGRLKRTFRGVIDKDTGQLVGSDSWQWVHCWDVERPHLYNLTVELLRDGAVVDTSLPLRFGYRDFKIEGRYFYLNGIRINLKPCAYWAAKGNWHTREAMEHWLRKAKAAGYNYVYLDRGDDLGQPVVSSHFLDLCDEVGMLAGVTVHPRINSFYRELEIPEVWKEWCAPATAIVRRNMAHPSLVMWRMNMNTQCYNQDQNPLFLDGKKGFEPGTEGQRREKMLLKTNAFVRSLDASRPIYNHACGRIGEVYTLNNYLGWPEPQDLREWLRRWAEAGSKPLMMVEQATPYPGDFQLRDPDHWWRNEPMLPEYGAICLDEKAYENLEDEYVDLLASGFREETGTWQGLYGYFCNNYPKIVDLCTAKAYENLIPAWRTWGLSGGMNLWENAWRRLRKRQPGNCWGVVPDPVPVAVDWSGIQRPGHVGLSWTYDGGGGGEIRSLFDRGEAWEAEYFSPTLRPGVLKRVLDSRYAYWGGPYHRWYTREHSYRSGEVVEKSLVFLNDRRRACLFAYSWSCVGEGKILAQGEGELMVNPGESARQALSFKVPELQKPMEAVLKATVKCDWKKLTVDDFPLEFYGKAPVRQETLSGWGVLDPTGKTVAAFAQVGYSLRALASDNDLPADLKVLVIGREALTVSEGKLVIPKALRQLDERLASGLRVLFLEQGEEVLRLGFGLRSFTPGSRKVRIRVPGHDLSRGLTNRDLRDWRGKTSLGPLDPAPATLSDSQRWKRVWRCSQEGVVASTLAEKPHAGVCRPILDVGFDLRYMGLWEARSGSGKLAFCQLDITDRVGTDVAAERILHNLVAWGRDSTPETSRQLAASADEPGAGKVLVLRHGQAQMPEAGALMSFLASGGTVVASGLRGREVALLSTVLRGVTFGQATLWNNRLTGQVPAVFAGISPAELTWRKRLTVAVLTGVSKGGWRSETGVLGVVPCGAGALIWLSADAGDFSEKERPDLVYSRVNAERALGLVLYNLGIDTGRAWKLGQTREAELYRDVRKQRDDPYQYMRW